MEARITMISLGVKDLERATPFYENIFGWEKTAASNEMISFFRPGGHLCEVAWNPYLPLDEEGNVRQ